MCLLILQKKEAIITDDSLNNAFDRNPDGVGYSFISNSKMVTKKYRNYNKFLVAYNEDVANYGKRSPFLLHFRMTTHGTNEGTFNVHPFKVREGLMFAHNGIISQVDDHKKLSDTQVFNREYLQKLDKSFLDNPAVVKLIEGFIGTSKLAFLNVDGSYKIINESFGHWKNNIWYSNSSYESSQITYYNPYTYGTLDDYKDDYSIYNGKPTKADNPHKASKLPNLKCEWCSDRVNSLTHYDISDKYDNESPVHLWLCDDCIEYESELEHIETEEYNKSFSLIEGRA